LSRRTVSIFIALYYRKAAQYKRCFEAIDCTKSDDVYEIYSVFINLANEYMRQCENVTLPGCTDLTFLQRVCIARNADRCNIYRLSVCLSVTFRCFVQTNEDTIMRVSASGRKIILVSEEVKFIRIFAGITPSE